MAAPAHSPRSERKRHALELFAGLPARYDQMGALLSFGQDPRWRRALVEAIAPRPGQRILDVATGTGLVATELVRRGHCEVVGLDQSEDMLGRARDRLARHPELAERISLVQGEAERLPFGDDEFDALTFTYLLRYVDDREATMRELARVVKPGARIGMVEFGVPRDAAARALWRLHVRAGLPARRARRLQTVVRGRALPGPEHRATRGRRAGPARPVAPSRDRGGASAAHELWRGPRHVGNSRWPPPRLRPTGLPGS